MRNIVVIGGGAAGMLAAISAAENGSHVILLEKNEKLGKKIYITGKGRCNLTNDVIAKDFFSSVVTNPKFLYGAINSFSPQDTIDFFSSKGLRLKNERGNRVFPESDKAKDVVNALRKYAESANIKYEKVTNIEINESSFLISTKKGVYEFDKVIVATGGKSYPLTGSDGSGYKLATKLGHTVTELIPSLIPLVCKSELCSRMQGLSLKNISITIKDQTGKSIYSDFGEMMFTHFGVTGPVILSASAHLRDLELRNLDLYIDLKPALDEKTLDTRLISDFTKNNNKDFINALSDLLPAKMIEPFVDYTGINAHKKVHALTKEDRHIVLTSLKSLKIPLLAMRPIEEAIITSGGIETKEITPKTMESKIISGLYFAGEIIDVDAYTGGYNLQIAFSTGYLAGKNAAEY